MRRNDGLYRLIKSLNRSEKRFFKIWSARHVIGGQNKYISLFDAIDKQRVYNEDAILKKFAGEKFVRRLSVAKAYLYDLILRSMNAYHAQNSVAAELRELLGNIQFLTEKGIHDQALKLVFKARKQAEQHELISFLPEIFRLHKRILEVQQYRDQSEQDLRRLLEEGNDIFQQLSSVNQHWWLFARLYRHAGKLGVARQAGVAPDAPNVPREVMAHPLLQEDAPLPTSYEAQLLRLRTLSTYYFLTRDLPNCYDHSKQLTDLLESRPEMLQQEPVIYVSAVNNLLNMTFLLSKDHERAHYLSMLRQMMNDKALEKNDSLQLRLFQAYFYHQMNQHIHEHTYLQGIATVRAMQEQLDNWGDRIDPSGESMLCFYGFSLAFIGEDHPYAYKLLQRLLAIPRAKLRQDIYLFAHLLEPLAAYELKQPETLQNALLNCYRFLYKKGAGSGFALEDTFLSFIKKLSKNTFAQPEEAWQYLQTEFSNIQNNPQEARAFAYFNFPVWLAAKRSGQSMSDLLAANP